MAQCTRTNPVVLRQVTGDVLPLNKRYRKYCERLSVKSGLLIHFEMFHIAGLNAENMCVTTVSQY